MKRMHIVVAAAAMTAAFALAPGSAQAGTAPSGAASAARPACADGSVPNVAPAVSSPPAPPAGFDPVHASAADLQHYGFPKRPPAGKDATWLRAMAQRGTRVAATPAWTCGSVTLGPGGNGTIGSTNWAGNEQFANVHGVGMFEAAEFDLVLPKVGLDYNHYDRSVIVPWVGIGQGNSSADQIVQAGVELNAYSSSPDQAGLVFEIYPQELMIHAAPFTVSIGDEIYIEVSDPGSVASFYFENVTHKQYTTYTQIVNGGTGSSAEWIAEKEGSLPVATWSGAMQLTDCWGQWTPYSNTSTWYSAGASYHDSVYMYTNFPDGAQHELVQGGAWTDSPYYAAFPIYRDGNQSQ